MTWTAQRPAIELAADWIAAAALAGALAFALGSVAPPGTTWVAAALAGVVGVVGGLILLSRVDRRDAEDRTGFVPVDLPSRDEALLLVDRVEEEPLLLDDPLPAIGADSRVVRLFAAPAAADEVAPLPAPGEMAARIETFLGVGRERPASAVPAAPDLAADASAALHAALADIRRSLRRA